jgi:bifunctional ADP-heptose synthase (sugar kinase/adenylyltransferase)
MSDATVQPDEAITDFCRQLNAGPNDLVETVESFKDLKVLVIGDTIFDRYAYVGVQGLTSKNRIISGRYLSEESQCGGALAVARHVVQFCPQTRFISLVGTEDWVDPTLAEVLAPEHDSLLREPDFTTIIKQRFVEPLSEGKELSKLFSVNYIDDEPPSADVLQRLHDRISTEIKKADVVLLTDFGHGMMQPAIRDLVQENSPYLCLNCQTNSNNHGFNIISRQYRKAHSFTLDKQELLLSCGHRHVDFAEEIDKLRQFLSAEYGWLTRGPVETIGNRNGDDVSFCPPLEREVIDTIGAGDAFFSVAALAAARQQPADMATFIGQLAGAQAVRIVGNVQSISKDILLKTGTSLLESVAK